MFDDISSIVVYESKPNYAPWRTPLDLHDTNWSRSVATCAIQTFMCFKPLFCHCCPPSSYPSSFTGCCRYVLKKPGCFLLTFPLMSVVTGHAAAFLGVFRIFLEQLPIGLSLLGLSSDRRLNLATVKLPDQDRLQFFALCGFIGVSVNGYLIWMMMHFRINYFWVYFVLFPFEAAVGIHHARAWFRLPFRTTLPRKMV